MNIQLRLFGACRDLHPEPVLQFTLADGSRIADLRRALPAQFTHADSGRAAALIAASAFASDEELLRDNDPLPADGRVAIMPPVSGG